jgi:hypothetical protein
MSKVVTLETKPRIEIDSGRVLKSSDAAFVGQPRYFVHHIASDGSSLTVWDGPDRADALDAAREWATSFSIPIVDKTGGFA